MVYGTVDLKTGKNLAVLDLIIWAPLKAEFSLTGSEEEIGDLKHNGKLWCAHTGSKTEVTLKKKNEWW